MPSQRRTGPTQGLASSKKIRNTNRKVNRIDQEIDEEEVRAEMHQMQLHSGEPAQTEGVTANRSASPGGELFPTAESAAETARAASSVDRASVSDSEVLEAVHSVRSELEGAEEEEVSRSSSEEEGEKGHPKEKEVLKSVSFYDIADVVQETQAETEDPTSEEFVVENLNSEREESEQEEDYRSSTRSSTPLAAAAAASGVEERPQVEAPLEEDEVEEGESPVRAALPVVTSSAPVMTKGGGIAFRVSVVASSPNMSPKHEDKSALSEQNLGSLNSKLLQANVESTIGNPAASSSKSSSSNSKSRAASTASSVDTMSFKGGNTPRPTLAAVNAVTGAEERLLTVEKPSAEEKHEGLEVSASERKETEPETVVKIVRINPSEVIKEAKQFYEGHDQLMVAGYLLKRKLEDRILQKYAKKDPVVQDILDRFADVEQVRHTLALIEKGRLEKERKEQEGGEAIEEGVVGEADGLYDAPMDPSREGALESDGLQDMRGSRKSVRKLPVPAADKQSNDRRTPGLDGNKNRVEKMHNIYDSLSDEELFGSEAREEENENEKQHAALGANQHPQHALQTVTAGDPNKFRPLSKWKLIREHEGIRAAMRIDQVFQDPKQEDTRVLTFSMEGACELDMFSILSLLNEADSWSNWVPTFMGLGLVKSEILEKTSPTNFVVRLLLRLPFPFAWRKVVFRVRGFDAMKAPLNKEDAKKEVKQVVMQLENVSAKEEREILTRSETYNADNEAEYEGSHRAFLDNSFFLVTPMRNGAAATAPGAEHQENKRCCYLQVVINIAPRVSSCPEWLVNATFKNLAFLIFEQIRQGGRLVEASLYRDRYMDPNNELYCYLRKRINEEIRAHGAPAMVDMPVGIEEESIETVHKVRKLIEKAMVEQMSQQQALEAAQKLPNGSDPGTLLPNPPGIDDPLHNTRDTTPTTTSSSAPSTNGTVTPITLNSAPASPRSRAMRETVVYAPDPMNRRCVIAQKVHVPAELPHGVAAQEAGMVMNQTAAAEKHKHNQAHSHHRKQHHDNSNQNSDDEFSSDDEETREERERQLRQAAFHASVSEIPSTYEDPAYHANLHADIEAWETRTNTSNVSGRHHLLSEDGERRADKVNNVDRSDSTNLLVEQLEQLISQGDAVLLKRNQRDQQVLDKPWALDYLHNERRVTILNVQEGMKVRPGLNWRYANEHLHQSFGRVVKYDLVKRFVRVEWESKGWFSTETKVYSHYRMGPTAFDLAVWKEEEELV